MYWDSVLTSSVEVAVAIAGFSGIIAVFGRRDDESWDVADKLRLQMLLSASASAVLFSYLPFILLEAKLDELLVWRAGSGVQIVLFVGAAIFRTQQAKKAGAGEVDLFVWVRVAQALALLSLLAQILNLIYANPWLYVIGVIWQLAVGFFAFTSLLLNSGMRIGDK